MSTRSTIGMKEGNQYKVVYCHFNGYPDGVGKILLQFHNSEESVKAILDLGHLSVLYRYLEPQVEVGPSRIGLYSGNLKELPHSYDHQHPDVTVAYGRDRGEKNTQAVVYDNNFEYNKNKQDYNYLWENGKWTVDGVDLEYVLSDDYEEPQELDDDDFTDIDED